MPQLKTIKSEIQISPEWLFDKLNAKMSIGKTDDFAVQFYSQKDMDEALKGFQRLFPQFNYQTIATTDTKSLWYMANGLNFTILGTMNDKHPEFNKKTFEYNIFIKNTTQEVIKDVPVFAFLYFEIQEGVEYSLDNGGLDYYVGLMTQIERYEKDEHTYGFIGFMFPDGRNIANPKTDTKIFEKDGENLREVADGRLWKDVAIHPSISIHKDNNFIISHLPIGTTEVIIKEIRK